jgi:hypothetical protein
MALINLVSHSTVEKNLNFYFIFQKEISHSWEFPSPARIVLKLKGSPGQLVFWVGTVFFFFEGHLRYHIFLKFLM